jgi:hypothetical protein
MHKECADGLRYLLIMLGGISKLIVGKTNVIVKLRGEGVLGVGP